MPICSQEVLGTYTYLPLKSSVEEGTGGKPDPERAAILAQ
jgi:hypothetical protein